MKEKGLVLVNLDELADRWQIPVTVVKGFIVDHGMNPACYEDWVATNWELFIAEKQKAFEASLFPRPLRPMLPESTS